MASEDLVFLDKLGQLIVKEIKAKIFEMDLYDTGDYVRSINYQINGDRLEIYSDVDYAEALEFGTYALADMGNDIPSGKIFKKKDLPPEVAKKLPMGMVPFAPFRKVLYDKSLIQALILEASVQ